MPNFLQNLGRSKFEDSIGNMIRTKLAFDQEERAGVESANRNALTSEQIIQAKRANQVAEEQAKHDNTPLPVNVLADTFEGGKDGPIFKHLLSKARAMGLVDETNPNNPTILRKYANNDMAKVFEKDAMQINNMRIDYLNQNKAAIQEQLLKKPDNEDLRRQLDSINMKLSQATMHDADLKEATKLAQAASIAEAHNKQASEANRLNNATSMRNTDVNAASRIAAANTKAQADEKKAGTKTAQIPPDIKVKMDWLKKFAEISTPSPIDKLLAMQGDTDAKEKLKVAEAAAKDPENVRLAKKYQKEVEAYNDQFSRLPAEDKSGPPELTPEIIAEYVKQGYTEAEVRKRYAEIYGPKK